MAPDSPIRVDAFTAYPPTVASARVRVVNFQPFLHEHAVELSFRPTLSAREYDLLVSSAHPLRKAIALARGTLRRAIAGQPSGLVLVHRLVLLASLRGVDPPARIDAYDFDDDLLVGSPADANQSFQWLKREAQRASASIRRARVVIAANPFLAARARHLNRAVEVIPSCVDPATQALHQHRDHEQVTIGWIGSHTTVDYLRPVLPVIARLNSGGRSIKLVVVGGDTGVREPWLEHRRWTLATQEDDLASFDIGIMPVPDTNWARGKSGYKILQYFAAGVPAIASPVGLNVELVSDDRGLLAETEADWKRALLEMTTDTERRRVNGAAARSFVEREYSYQRWAPELASLLRNLA